MQRRCGQPTIEASAFPTCSFTIEEQEFDGTRALCDLAKPDMTGQFDSFPHRLNPVNS